MPHDDPQNPRFDDDPESAVPDEPAPPSAPTPEPAVGGPPGSPIGTPPGTETQPASKPAPEASPSSGRALPIVAGLVLVGLLVAAWYFTMGPGAGAGGPGESGVVASPDAAGGAPPPPPQPDAELDALRADFEALSEQIASMQARIDAMPEAEPPPDLSPIQERLDALEELPGRVQSLSDTLTALDERITAVEATAASAREEVASLSQQVEQLRSTVSEPEPAAEAAADAEGPALAGEELGQVARLFDQRQYEQARTILQKLQQENPEDARVWYYSALAHGFTTGDWEGETLELVRRGAERERAGTPETAVIDREFDDLPAATRDWLDYYRRQAP